jgi:TfoX/Sxy family transcriptional regulator of competence genes
MAYDEYLAERVAKTLKEKNIDFKEMKMMGGIAYMVNDKMCVGITNSDLMARIDPIIYEEALTNKGVREMDFTKKPMKGWIYVSPEVIDTDEDLADWIQLALDYNPKAKSSKKKN